MADEEGYELTMPFVICQSEGGPYEDAAFTAGFVCGTLYVGLGQASITLQSRVVIDQPIKRDYLKQLDLIAMRLGYTCEVGGDDPDWCNVTFVRGEADGR